MYLQAGLYIVATPIGNLKDITIRAIETLQNSHYILCEDTRVSKILLQKYDIQANLMLYNDHSDHTVRDKILAIIQQGNAVSLVSDAGTPLISDPGYKLVNHLRSNNCLIDVLPGPSSVVSALCLSAMPSDKFIFLGFAPRSLGEKTTYFKQFAQVGATMIFFETAKRIFDTMQIALQVLGNRNCSIVREITKLHQEVIKDTLENIVLLLEQRALKGEIVVLVEQSHTSFEDAEIIGKLKLLLEDGMSKSQAAKVVSTLFKYNKNTAYNLVKNL
jgi:16S rRNA (cytidine1402-2'-O)-methyltransferase